MVTMTKEFKRKRMLSFFIINVYMFLGGVEYAVIFPTAWEYLQSLGVTDEYYLGLLVSAYSLSSSITAILGGRLADVYIHDTKKIVLVSVVVMTLGSFQYTLGINVWNIILSRLICGCGIAAAAAMLADLCRVTDVEERTPMVATYNAARQIGILIGPAFQIILSLFNFTILGYEFTPLNSPGAFMGVIWIFFIFAVIFMFYNLTSELKALEEQEKQALLVSSRPRRVTISESEPEVKKLESSTSSSVSNYGAILEDNNEDDENGLRRRRGSSLSERFVDSLAKAGEGRSVGDVEASVAVAVTPRPPSYKQYVDEFLTDTLVLLMSIGFVLWFCQVMAETVIPIQTQNYFGYGAYENSLIYMAGGMEALIVFFGVAILSRYYRDTTLLVVGWVIVFVSQVWLMLLLPTFTGTTTDLIYYLSGNGLLYMGFAIAYVSSTGLYSKLLRDEAQGFGQGIRRLVGHIGLIFGPSWGGACVQNPYLYLGVPVAILSINSLMLVVSFSSLRAIEDKLSQKYLDKKAEENNGRTNDLEKAALLGVDREES